MTIEDLEFKLILGLPIEIGQVTIHPVTLKKMAHIGYVNYNQLVSILCIDQQQIEEMLGMQVEPENLYRSLVYCCLKNEQIQVKIITALSLFCRDKIILDEESMSFVVGETIISSETFYEIQRVVRIRNCIEMLEEDIENPANDRAKKLLEQRKKMRERLRQSKSKDDEEHPITLADLVSILASGLGVKISEISEYDMYQFNDQFNRLKIIKDYEVNIQALIHGASGKESTVKYWICKNDIKII